MGFFNLVARFNYHVLGIDRRNLQILNGDEAEFAIKCLREEVVELEEAFAEGDLVGVLDALADLQYFHHGILYKMGVPFHLYEQVLKVVHEANMEKGKGVKESRAVSGASDAIKPEGWISPEIKIEEVVNAYKFRRP